MGRSLGGEEIVASCIHFGESHNMLIKPPHSLLPRVILHSTSCKDVIFYVSVFGLVFFFSLCPVVQLPWCTSHLLFLETLIDPCCQTSVPTGYF